MASAYQNGGIARIIPSSTSGYLIGSRSVAHQRKPTDPIFSTNLKLVSLETGYGYSVSDKDSVVIGTGDFTSSPQYYNNVDAFSDADPVTVYFCKYGYQLKASGFALTPVETLLYMEHKVNAFIVETAATAEGYADTGVTDKIIVDFANKKLTVNVAISGYQLYHYMQWWQSQPANAAALSEGNIYNTIDGVNYLLKSDWTRIDTGGPVYCAIDGDGVDHTGQFVKDADGVDTTKVYSATFTTIQAAFADPAYGDRDLVSDNIQQFYHVYRSALPYQLYDFAFYPANIANTGPQNMFVLTSAPEQQHKGVITDAPKIDFNHGAYWARHIIKVQYYSEVSFLHFEHGEPTVNVNSYISCININGAATVSSNFCTGDATGAGQKVGINHNNDRYSGVESLVENNVCYSCSYGILAASYARGDTINNLCIDNVVYGLAVLAPHYTGVIANNVALNNGTFDLYSDTTSSIARGTIYKNNASGDGSVIVGESQGPDFGMANDGTYLTDLLASEEFKNIASRDYRLTGGSRLRGTGFNSGAYGVTLDFEGDTRVVPYSIGPDHPLSFNVPVVITVLDARNSLPVQGAIIFIEAGAVGSSYTEGALVHYGTSDANGQTSFDHLYDGSDQSILGKVRKVVSSPFYKTANLSGDILVSGLNLTVYVTEEI